MQGWRRTKRTARAAAETPAGLSETVLDAADRDLLAVVDARLKTAARAAGPHLACRLGCTECCFGPFPINRLDARRLRRGLALLEESDPKRAAAVRGRAQAAVAAFRADFPGDPATGRLSGDEPAEDRFFETRAADPCPALDPATGGCDLYAHRPISCRTYGPPVRLGGRDLPPCRLCFTAAPTEAVERCRIDPDPDRIEDVVLDRMRKGDGDDRETVVAFALGTDAP